MLALLVLDGCFDGIQGRLLRICAGQISGKEEMNNTASDVKAAIRIGVSKPDCAGRGLLAVKFPNLFEVTVYVLIKQEEKVGIHLRGKALQFTCI